MNLSQAQVLALDTTYDCRFKARHHTKSDEVMATARQYMVDHWPWKSDRAKKFYIMNNIEEATCMSFPACLDDRLETTTIWFSYFLLVDDIIENSTIEEGRTFVDRLSSVMLGKREPEANDPHDQVVAHVRARLLSSLSSQQTDKYGADVLEETSQWLADVISHDERLESMKSFEAFLKWREIDVGVWFTIALLLWGCGIYMPDYMANDEDIKHLELIAGLHLGLANDLYSYRVEILGSKQVYSPSNFIYNVIPVIAAEMNTDIQTAMNELKRRLASMEDEFEMAAKKVQEKYIGEEGILAEKLVRACQDMMAGNCAWSTTCMRYNVVQDVYL